MASTRYSKVSRRVWVDRKFNELSSAQPNGQTLWFRLLTGPELTAIPGLFPARESGLAEALGWTLEGFRKAFGEVFAKGMAKADWRAGLVWIPKAMEHNRPESPNVVIGWAQVFNELPECDLKTQALRELKAFAEGLGKAFAVAFGKAFPEGSPNQEQEQEQEQDLRESTRAPVLASSPAKPTQADIESAQKRIEGCYETECPDELLEYTEEHQKLCRRIGEPIAELWADFRAKRRAKGVKAAMPVGWSADFEGWLRTFARNKRERDARSSQTGTRVPVTHPISEPRVSPKDRAAAFDLGLGQRSGTPMYPNSIGYPKTRPGATSSDSNTRKVG